MLSKSSADMASVVSSIETLFFGAVPDSFWLSSEKNESKSTDSPALAEGTLEESCDVKSSKMSSSSEFSSVSTFRVSSKERSMSIGSSKTSSSCFCYVCEDSIGESRKASREISPSGTKLSCSPIGFVLLLLMNSFMETSPSGVESEPSRKSSMETSSSSLASLFTGADP